MAKKVRIKVKQGAKGVSLGEAAYKLGIEPSAPRKTLLRKADVKLNTHLKVERR